MRVRYNPVLGILLIVIGAIAVLLGLWLLLLGEFNPSVLVGLLCVALGVPYLVRPYFFLHEDVLVVPAPIGPVKRRFPFRTIEVHGSKLVALRDDGTYKKLPVARWAARRNDWNAVVATIAPAGRA